MENKLMTSIKLQKKLHLKLQQKVIADGYGMRGKSKWIIEAIEAFLGFEDYPTLVDIAEDMTAMDDTICLRLPESILTRIEHAVLEVRRRFPVSEGVKSNLIRASILQRLLRTDTSVTEV